jgi:hypothetical protein
MMEIDVDVDTIHKLERTNCYNIWLRGISTSDVEPYDTKTSNAKLIAVTLEDGNIPIRGRRERKDVLKRINVQRQVSIQRGIDVDGRRIGKNTGKNFCGVERIDL